MDQIPPYKDEYWDAALKTLKRAERKAMLRRMLPFLVFIALLGLGGLAWLGLNTPSTGKRLSLNASDSGILIYKAHRSIEWLEESKGDADMDLNAGNLRASSGNASHLSGTFTEEQLIKPTNASDKAEGVREVEIERGGSSTSSNPIAAQSLIPSEAGIAPIHVALSELAPEKSDDKSKMETNSTRSMLVSEGQSTNKKTGVTLLDLEFMPMLGIPQYPVKSGIPLRRTGSTKFKSLYLADRVNHLYLEFGNGMLTGFGTNRNDLSFNPQIGLGYERQIGAEIAVSAGISYYQVSGMNYGISIDQTELGFGSITTRTTIEANTLKYLLLPIRWNYHLDQRHSLGLHASMAYLIDAESTVAIDRNEVTLSEANEGGYSQGFKPLSFALGAQYNFRLNNRWGLELVYSQGLTEVQKSKYYEGTGNDRNTRVILGLNYQIKP